MGVRRKEHFLSCKPYGKLAFVHHSCFWFLTRGERQTKTGRRRSWLYRHTRQHLWNNSRLEPWLLHVVVEWKDCYATGQKSGKDSLNYNSEAFLSLTQRGSQKASSANLFLETSR